LNLVHSAAIPNFSDWRVGLIPLDADALAAYYRSVVGLAELSRDETVSVPQQDRRSTSFTQDSKNRTSCSQFHIWMGLKAVA
jgi:hypothetical protein